ncbi:site-specific DNA-methyltransferase [Anaerococcus nagyae]|uniref:Site-specific DNA-methyltransferase n=2 Tax=Anaerococcus nagyae TaxID=1755241 RepID=A0A3E2TGX9_9FIRM|nr:site-specific DNA-methyltransferase [Anaerococcus nagyae]
MHTNNLANEKYQALKDLFPNAITETIDENGEIVRAIDKDILMQEISTKVVEGKEERYQFTWPDKKKAILNANAPINKTLRPCREESVNFDKTENLYIEGDNLEVLKLLQETYLGKIKMIYIDPPYNTGNDFVYNNDFKESVEEYLDNSGQYDEEGNRLEKNLESNGRYHTDWLNMMYPRLKLARDLLSEDGVIFISIDDNEQENLKKICDEIFGGENFLTQIAWRRSDNQPNIGKIAKVKEFICCYCKSIKSLDFGRLPLSDKAIKEYQYSDKRGRYGRGIIKDDVRGRFEYTITTPNGNKVEGPWNVPENEFNELVSKNMIHWPSSGEVPRLKIYLEEAMKKGQIPNDFWDNSFGSNQRGATEIKDLFNERVFDFPKPTILLKSIIGLGSSKDTIILDFFSGSATTAHATMQLNAEDGGNRKFIMVQLPEATDEKSEAYKAGYKHITDIGKERIRRAGEKILADSFDKEDIENLDIGFRVLKTDSSNMKNVYYSPADTEQNFLDDLTDNIKEDRTSEDLLFQVMLDLGVSLSSKIESETIDGKEVFVVEDGFLIACFDKNVSDDIVKEIAKKEPYYAVFRDRSMASDSVAANFDQIFASISPETVRRVI